MNYYLFDDRSITWQTLPGFDHFEYSILDIDEDALVVDVIFKFEAHKPIVLHRHCALNHTFVIQGEHRLYHQDGALKEIRSVASYTKSLPDEEPHQECGGDEGAIVLFSIRGTDGVMYEILDEERNVIASLGMLEFKQLLDLQMSQASDQNKDVA